MELKLEAPTNRIIGLITVIHSGGIAADKFRTYKPRNKLELKKIESIFQRSFWIDANRVMCHRVYSIKRLGLLNSKET